MNERFLEAVGPIVVKEVRQGLRARVFAICFALLLVACVTTSLIAATEVRSWDGGALGPRYLTLFLSGLALICFFVIPYSAYRSMSREREDETWVLLALTGLSSRRIVRGKVASALTQAILYASAGAPFLLFSYFLNGVDLPTLLLELVFATCWAVFVTSVAVALGTEGHTRLGRSAIHFLVLGLLGAATFAGIGFGAELAREGGEWVNETSFLVFAGAFPFALLTTSLLVLEGAAAGLALASDASARGARLVVCGQLLFAVCAAYLGVWLADHPPRELASVASVFSSILLVAYGAFAISERDGFPRSTTKRSWLTAGALRGWLMVIGLLALVTAAWFGLHVLLVGNSRFLALTLTAPLYVALYLSLAVIVGRASPLQKLGEPAATRVAFICLVAAASIFFPVAAVLSGNNLSDIDWNVLNPLIGMFNHVDDSRASQARQALPILSVTTAFAVLGAFVTLKVRDGARVG